MIIKLRKNDHKELETHSFFIKIVRIFTVPIMNNISEKFLKKIMKKTSDDAGTVVDKGGTTHALEVMYTRYNRKLFYRGFIQGFSDLFWHHCVSQPKAIRNRLKIVKNILKDISIKLIKNKQRAGDNSPINILSVAGGSSRSIIYTVAEFKKQGENIEFEVITLDKDQSALNVGKKIAEEEGVSKNFTWIAGRASEVELLIPHKKFDIIEIVGLLDYFTDERVLRLLINLSNILKSDGSIVVANVIPNTEMNFTHKTGWPNMIYRRPTDLEKIFQNAGFFKNDIIIEPLKVHMIVIARR